MSPSSVLNSSSVGDPDRFLAFAELAVRLLHGTSSPRDTGTVTLLVSCREAGERHLPAQVLLTPEQGMPEDQWGRQPHPDPAAQLAVMQTNVAELVANGQPLPLFGDNLWLDLDLSNENLPTGSRLQIGDCVLEVTPLPHNGCKKFQSRFGADALRFVNNQEIRHRNLRGIYLRVVAAGLVAVGDQVSVVSRPTIDA